MALLLLAASTATAPTSRAQGAAPASLGTTPDPAPAPVPAPGDPGAAAATAGAVQFADAERARILSHGPWPADGASVRARDPTNRVSGNADAAALGARLFFDPALSADGRVACSTCHDPARAFTDGRPRAVGIGRHDRNTQGLLDVARQRWFGWDGGADSLWAASIRPMLAAHEMGATPASVARRIRDDAALLAAYRRVFGVPTADDETTMVNAAKAIAAYVETLASPRTPFDEFRDALARGDTVAMARYPAAAQRGLRLFVGRGQCSVCHFGPAFTNGEFHDVGIPFLVEPGRVDPGRFAGVRRARQDPYNLLSRFNDQPPGRPDAEAALKTRTVMLMHRNWGEWKVPTLRGLSATAPYMHDGSKPTLRDVVRHYSELNEDRLHSDGEALLRPLRLSEAEIDDLLAFLATLDPPRAAGPMPIRPNTTGSTAR